MPWRQHLPTHLRFRGEETNPEEEDPANPKPPPPALPSPTRTQPSGPTAERLRGMFLKAAEDSLWLFNAQRPRSPDAKPPSRASAVQLPKAASDVRPWGGRKAGGPRSACGVPAARGRHSGTQELGAHTAAQLPAEHRSRGRVVSSLCPPHTCTGRIQIRNVCLLDVHVCTRAGTQ